MTIRIEGFPLRALIIDPLTELVTIDGVGLRDAGIAVAFDVVLKSAETLLPLRSFWVPCPGGKFFEPAFPVSWKGTLIEEDPTSLDPITELVSIDGVRGRDAGIAVVFDVVLKSAETLLPPGSVGVPRPTG